MLYPTQTVMQLSEKHQTMNPSICFLTKTAKSTPLLGIVHKLFTISLSYSVESRRNAIFEAKTPPTEALPLVGGITGYTGYIEARFPRSEDQIFAKQ